MGFKLQDKIQQMRGIPGKYKRILTAIAQRARNDGTNFYESKNTISEKAGVNRATTYRNIDAMVELGALVEATSHECSNKDCPKESKHFFMAGNHWTEAFDLNLDAIFNIETWSRDQMQHDSENSRVAKRRKCRVAKSTKSGVAKCDPIQGVNSNHVSLGLESEPPALTSGSEKASEQETEATPPTPASLSASPESQNPDQVCGVLPSQNQTDADFEAEFWSELVLTPAGQLLTSIQPKPSMAMAKKALPICERILTHFDLVTEEFQPLAAEMVLKYNRAHRGHKFASKDDKKYYIRTAERYLAALESENAFLLNDYYDHPFHQCEICQAADVHNYRTFIAEMVEKRERREREKLEEAQRAVEAAAKQAERERLAKLCEHCKDAPRIHSLPATWVAGAGWRSPKVCDACYDKKYESQQQPGWRQSDHDNPRINPRPGYLEAKQAAEEAARVKAMEDAEVDVPICTQCGQVSRHALDCPTRCVQCGHNPCVLWCPTQKPKVQEAVAAE